MGWEAHCLLGGVRCSMRPMGETAGTQFQRRRPRPVRRPAGRPAPPAARSGRRANGAARRCRPAAATTARSDSSGPSSPSTTSASAPIGELQPASSAASTARSARTAALLSGSSSAASRREQGRVVGADLDGQRALAGRRQHLDRVEDLGGLVGPAEPQQSGPGQHDGVVAGPRRPPAAGSRRCRGSARPADRGRGRAAGPPAAANRCRPWRRRGSSPRVRPSRATRTSRGSSRRGIARDREPVGWTGRADP